jgi:hypothetical protein
MILFLASVTPLFRAYANPGRDSWTYRTFEAALGPNSSMPDKIQDRRPAGRLSTKTISAPSLSEIWLRQAASARSSDCSRSSVGNTTETVNGNPCGQTAASAGYAAFPDFVQQSG